ncbi:MAG: hypothetical protein WBW88_03695 [Rhodothermales bacterium]
MGKINYGRVLLGGLLAGVVITIGEFILNTYIVADQWMAFTEQHSLPSPDSAGMAVLFIVINFLVAIVIVLQYALMRPRCGAGPKTAVQAGLFVWFLAWVLCFGGIGISLALPSGLILTTTIWGLVELVLAALAGGWVYKEEEAQAVATAE